MGNTAVIIRLGVAEYLEMERMAEVRHEYHQGEIFAMAGGTFNLSRLGVNRGTELN